MLNSLDYSKMNSRNPILGLRACLSVALVTVIFVGSPTHSHIVRRDTSVNKLCGDERLYFQETRKCYPVKKKGPCGELMVLEPSNDDKNIGECNCDYIKGVPVCPQRPKVFWEQESRCYHIYDQGPCKKGEWVVPHKDRSPSCERVTCPERNNAQIQKKYFYSGSNGFVFPHDGGCYQANSKESGLCPAEEYVFFRGGDSFNLHCSKSIVCGVSQFADTDCVDGSTPDFQGGCEPVTVL